MDILKYIEEISGAQGYALLRIGLIFLVWCIVIFAVARMLRLATNRFVQDNSLRYNIKKNIRFSSYVLVLLVALASFTDSIRSFTVAIGIISAGIAFALQEVILSFAF